MPAYLIRRAGTSLAKGLPERLVLTRHLVRDAVLPMITLVGLSVPALLAGNLVADIALTIAGPRIRLG